MEPMIWLGILAVLLLIEAITAGLTTIWFAGGALVAAVAAYCGAGVFLQFVLFFAVSLVLLVFTRPVAVRYMNRNVEKTNAESLLGKKAVVIEKIDNLAQTRACEDSRHRVDGANLGRLRKNPGKCGS